MASKQPTVAPSDIGAQSTGSVAVDEAIFAAAKQYGVPPEVLFADAQVESGLNPGAVGDNGTSFGLFQEHQGGELTSIASALDPSYAATKAAQTFHEAQVANPGATWGEIAAAAQRPANQGAYAQQVNSMLGNAGRMPSTQASRVLGSSVTPSLTQPGGNVTTKSARGGFSNFADTAAQALINPQYASQLGGYIAGQAAPGIAGANLTEAQALASAGVSPAAIQLGAQNLATNTGYALAQGVGTIQGIKLQEQGLGSQIGTAAKQQGNELQQYENQIQQLGLQGQSLQSQAGYVGQQQGFQTAQDAITGGELGQAQTYLGQQEGTAAQEFSTQQAELANQSAQIAYEYPLQLQSQTGQAAASGASNTVGNRNALANISATYGTGGFEQTGLSLQGQQLAQQYQGQQQGFANEAANLGFQGQQNALSSQETQAGYAQQLAQLGIQQQGNTLSTQLAGLQQQSEVIGYQGQSQQNANAMQQLQLAAQQAGIPIQQAISQLGYGLQQLGIQNDPTSYLAQAAGAQGTAASNYSAALSAASVSGGLPPSFAQATKRAK